VKLESGEEKTFHVNILKKYNDREGSSYKPLNKLIAKKEVSADIEGPINESEVEEAIMGVIVDSDEDEENQNSEENRDVDRQNSSDGMGVVVDSDDEENECQERVEESELGYYSTERKETWRDVNINPELSRQESRQL